MPILRRKNEDGTWSIISSSKNKSGMTADGGFAGGKDATARAGAAIGYQAEATVDAIQLGSGTNNAEKSLQVYDKQLMNSNGMIPFARYAKFVQGTSPNTLQENVVANNHIVYSETGDINPGSVIIMPVLRSGLQLVTSVRYHNGNTMIQVTRPVGMEINSTISDYYVDYWIFSQTPSE